MATTDMSSDELRAHLYRSLQGKGILDSLKSQLRNRLATELQMSMEASSSPSRKRKQASSDVSLATGHSHTISVQVANSIVAEHMKKCGYEYSLSVFLPEGGITLEKLLSIDEILHYLRISPASPLHQTLKSTDGKCGFLVHLLDALIDTSQSSATTVAESKHCAAVQTDDTSESQISEGSESKPSVADKLKAVDESYAQKAEEETLKANHSIVERIGLIQSELEARYKKQLESELSLYRARELAKVRLEEREKYLEEMAREKTQLNQDHQRKIDEVRKREQHIVDEYRLKEQELEASIYSQRQSLLSELDGIRRKEEERKRQIELSKKSIDIEEQRLRAMAEDLENQRKKLQQAAEEKAQRYRQEIESNFRTREIDLKRQEEELQVTHQAASATKSDHQTLVDQLKEEREKNNRLQALLHETTSKQISSEKQKDSLAQKLNEMSDYQNLKQRTLDLQRQLTATSKKLSETKMEYKQRNSEQQQLIKSLQSRLSNPSSKLLALQVEIDQLQKTHQEEMIVFECDNKELRKQLSIQAEYCQELQKHMDNQMLQLRTAQREVDDLRQILEHLKPTMLPGGNNENSERKTRRPIRTTKKASRNHPPPHHQLHHQHTTTTTAITPITIPLHSQSITTPHSGPHSSFRETQTVNFSDSSAQFLAETRETFARLEREAEELEKSYQSVRHPASSSSLIAPLFDAMPKPQYTLASYNTLDLGPGFGVDLHNLSSSSVVTTVPSIHSPMSDESESTLSPKYRLSPAIPNDVVTSSGNVPDSLLVPPPSPPVIPVTTTQHPLPDPLLHIPTSNSTAPLPAVITSNPPPLGLFTPATMGSTHHHPLPAPLQPVVTTSTLPAHPQFTVTPTVSTIPQTIPSPVSTKPSVDIDDTKNYQSFSSASESEVVCVTENQSVGPLTTVVSTTSAVSTAQAPIVTSSQTASGVSVKESSPTKISLDDWWKTPVQVDLQAPLHVSNDRSEQSSINNNNYSEPTSPSNGGGTDLKLKEVSQKLNTNGAVELIEEPLAAASVNEPLQDTVESGSVEHLTSGVDSHASDKDEQTQEKPQISHKSQGTCSTSACKSEDDGIDPVMLKYMEMVTQKREEEKREQKTVAMESVDRDRDSPHSRDFDVPSLSQASEGFGGLSDDGDPFEDW